MTAAPAEVPGSFGSWPGLSKSRLARLFFISVIPRFDPFRHGLDAPRGTVAAFLGGGCGIHM